MKVLHAPVNIGNQPWGLTVQENLAGLESSLVVNYNTWLKYPCHICLSEYGKKTPADLLRRIIFSITAPFRYDVLHYYFGRSLFCWDDFGPPNSLWYLDIKMARALGKKVFMTFQGCDARRPDLSDKRNEITPCLEGFCGNVSYCKTQFNQQRIDIQNKIVPLCDGVFFLNPELGHYINSGTFLPYASVEVDAIPEALPAIEGKIRILHAPTDDSVKGTAIIQEVIERLKTSYAIEFILIKGMPHEEAVKNYERADLVIDQLLAGWYGGFAVEVMAMGKPLLCYMREDDFKFLPGSMAEEIPVINTRPDTLEKTLIEVLEQRSEWQEWGKKCRTYVRRWHNPRIIAMAMIEAYKSADSRFDLEAFVVGKRSCAV